MSGGGVRGVGGDGGAGPLEVVEVEEVDVAVEVGGAAAGEDHEVAVAGELVADAAACGGPACWALPVQAVRARCARAAWRNEGPGMRGVPLSALATRRASDGGGCGAGGTTCVVRRASLAPGRVGSSDAARTGRRHGGVAVGREG